MQHGYTLLEILWALALTGLLASTALDVARVVPKAEQCAEQIRSSLASAAQQSMALRRKQTMTFDTMRETAVLSPPAVVLSRLPRPCELVTSAFGGGGARSPDAIYYGNGVTTPGSILVSSRNGSCRITQSLYGKHSAVCRSTDGG